MFISLSEKDIQDFKGQTLLLPGFSPGKTGSLALDLLIHNYSFAKIGYLDIEYVYPAISNLEEPQFKGKSGLALPAEVYVRDNIVILQFRSDIVKGRKKEFLTQISDFIEKYAFGEIICLASLSLFQRPDIEINSGGQVKVYSYFNGNFKQEKFKTKHLKPSHELLHDDIKEIDLLEDAGIAHNIAKMNYLKKNAYACLFAYSRTAIDFQGALYLAEAVGIFMDLTPAGQAQLAIPFYWKEI